MSTRRRVRETSEHVVRAGQLRSTRSRDIGTRCSARGQLIQMNFNLEETILSNRKILLKQKFFILIVPISNFSASNKVLRFGRAQISNTSDVLTKS